MLTDVTRVVSEALAKGYQLEPEALHLLQGLTVLDPVELVERILREKRAAGDQSLLITKDDVQKSLPPGSELIVIEGQRVKPEFKPEEVEEELKILAEPTPKIDPKEGMGTFQSLFRSRYDKLLRIAKERPEFGTLQPIASATRQEGDLVKRFAGLVMTKRMVKNRIELTIDDHSGSVKVFALDESVRRTAAEVCLDQLVLIDFEVSKRGMTIAKVVQHPDIPERVPRLAKKDVYAVLTSDIHVGNKAFLVDAFNRFLLWLSGKGGDLEIVRRLKYIIVCGDIVDGIGVYPDQERELEEHDIRKQFLKVAQLFEQIPKHIRVMIIPGNHDPVRQALPQPSLPRSYAEDLYSLENVTMLGNPSEVSLHGVNILIYHGQSLFDIVTHIPGQTFSKPANAMKVLLKARHLAPIYGARTSIASELEDHLVIERAPDILHSGHIHVLDADRYRGTLVVNSGAWQGKTKYQEIMGISPTPGIAPIVNLSTLDIITKDFTRGFESL